MAESKEERPFTLKKRVSEWLEDIHSHSILGYLEASEDFRNQTNIEDTSDWPCYTRDEMIAKIEARGLGGELNGEGPFVPACEIAAHYAAKLVGFESIKLGRGSAYRECVEALRNGQN